MKRSKPLARRAPLAAHKPLGRRTPLREVSLKRAASSGKPARPKDTGPDRATRALVLERDDWCCFCCGTPILDRPYSLQHRDSRGMGGSKNPRKNSPANLITLLGSATTDCHGRVEGRHVADNVAGYWLKTGQDPAATPVLHWRYGPVLLNDAGGVTVLGRAA